MKTVTVMEDMDYEILRRLQYDYKPCMYNCPNPEVERSKCPGCDKKREWDERWTEVEAAGLENVMRKVQHLRWCQDEIKKLHKQVDGIEKELEVVCIDLQKLSVYPSGSHLMSDF